MLNVNFQLSKTSTGIHLSRLAKNILLTTLLKVSKQETRCIVISVLNKNMDIALEFAQSKKKSTI